jgi:glycosyltransferase involved in cell wall biosynthesis
MTGMNASAGRATVSVLLPVYNGARFVSRAIESVLGQTYQKVELVIVNDGSQDNSAEVIRPYLRDERVRYIEQVNRGVAAARNRALREATGEFVGLIDQDDVWLPDKLNRQVQVFMARPEVALVHCDALAIDKDDRFIAATPWGPRPEEVPGFVQLFVGNPVRACTALFRREAAVSAGGFDTSAAVNFADEYDLWLRIARSHEVAYIDSPLAYYRLHDANNSADKAVMVLATLTVLRKTLRDQPEAEVRVGRMRVRERVARLYLTLYRARLREGRPDLAIAAWLTAFWHSPRHAVWLSLSQRERNRFDWYRTRIARLLRGH